MAARAKHIHMVGVSQRAFSAAMASPVSRIFDLMTSLKNAMRPTSRLVVRSAQGTNIEIEMAPHLRWFPNGHVVRAGQWINVPHGALVTSPASVNGVYVVDASIGGALGARTGLLASRPIRIVFDGGRVRSVDCRDTALRQYVERFVSEAPGHDRVGLLSLGANIGIVSPNGEILHDEHMPGAHLGLGDNFASQTGATSTSHGQLAFAIAECDVDLDGTALIRRGRYVRFV
jgi:leucyl aminopeptidase (aminopeptidase T)